MCCEPERPSTTTFIGVNKSSDCSQRHNASWHRCHRCDTDVTGDSRQRWRSSAAAGSICSLRKCIRAYWFLSVYMPVYLKQPSYRINFDEIWTDHELISGCRCVRPRNKWRVVLRSKDPTSILCNLRPWAKDSTTQMGTPCTAAAADKLKHIDFSWWYTATHAPLVFWNTFLLWQ